MKKIARYFTQKQLDVLEEFMELYGLEFRQRYTENMFRAIMDAIYKNVPFRKSLK